MNDWQLEMRDTGRTVVQRLVIADGYWGRLRGLQFRRLLPPGQGILLAPCASIHTMWMRFAIDAAMLELDRRLHAAAEYLGLAQGGQ